MTESDEHAYFLAIEEAFIRLRGAPLLLSPADWRVASEWHREGVPLDLVLATLEEVFARRAERDEPGAVQTLRYCRRAVARAWRQRREVTATGARRAPSARDPGAILAELAAAIPDDLAGAAALRERITVLEGDSERVERVLAELDREMMAAAEAALDPVALADLDRAVDQVLEGLSEKLSPTEATKARDRLRRQILRRRTGLPVLSMFAGGT